MNEAVSAALEESGWKISLAKDQLIMEQGTAVGFAYYVVSGTLKAHARLDDGSEQIFGIIKPGEWFGEISGLFIGGMARASVSSIEDCVLYEVSAHSLTELMKAKPPTAYQVLLSLASTMGRRIAPQNHERAVSELFAHCERLANNFSE